MKREGASTLFIHGYPWALSYLFRSLAFSFQLFEMVLCVWFWKMFWKEAFCLGNLYNDSCLNVYKGVCLLKIYFNVWKFVLGNFLKLCCEVCLKIARMFLQVLIKKLRVVYPILLKDLSYVFNPFNSVVSPLYLVNNLVLGC